jgi:hypothetical protein
MTVAELLTGMKQPLSNAEYIDWIAWTRVHNNKLEQQQTRAEMQQNVRQAVRRR